MKYCNNDNNYHHINNILEILQYILLYIYKFYNFLLYGDFQMKQITIDIPYAEIKSREKRWSMAMNFQQPDRVPVLHYLGSRFWLPKIGFEKRFKEYLNNPQTMFEAQLLGSKWILENIKSDFHKIVCYPDFMWAEDVNSYGANISYSDNDSPWVSRPHLLAKKSALEDLKKIDYINFGLHGKMIEFYNQMKIIAEEYEIIFSDGKILKGTDCLYMGGGGIIGPMVLAGDLRGLENLSLDFYDDPPFVKELLSLITEKSIEWLDHIIKISGGRAAFCSNFYNNTFFIGDDGTAQMSLPLIEKYALEPLKKLSDHLHLKGFEVMAHNCGLANHILKFWAEDIKIDTYLGFSYLTDKKLLNEIMGGKIKLIGGIDTVKLKEGTIEDVKEDVRKNILIFKNTPGYIMMDGHNVAPGTPVENLNAVIETVEENN